MKSRKLIPSLFLVLTSLTSFSQVEYCVGFVMTDNNVLSTQNITSYKNLNKWDVDFFYEDSEKRGALYPFGSIADYKNNEFKMLGLFSDNIPLKYDAGKTKVYIAFDKVCYKENICTIRLAESPITETLSDSDDLLYLPTLYNSVEEANAEGSLLSHLLSHYNEEFNTEFQTWK